jgi:hypothetical protein
MTTAYDFNSSQMVSNIYRAIIADGIAIRGPRGPA